MVVQVLEQDLVLDAGDRKVGTAGREEESLWLREVFLRLFVGQLCFLPLLSLPVFGSRKGILCCFN